MQPSGPQKRADRQQDSHTARRQATKSSTGQWAAQQEAASNSNDTPEIE
ncbi:hypothetical protein [Haladaptatus sp. DFWS20]